MPVPLLDNLDGLRDRIVNCAQRLLLFDYDGTLTPIVDHPTAANLSDDTRELMRRLTQDSATTMGIVSGRALRDVRSRVGFPDLVYAGNHGLEIQSPDFHYVNPAAFTCQDKMQELADTLTKRLQPIPGAWVENKQFTLTVHIRKVPDSHADELRAILLQTLMGVIAYFEITGGIKIYEIRPKADWNKGSAVGWLRTRPNFASAFTVYLGDDLTDEDAFRSLSDGLTVKVGYSPQTAAEYFVESPREVARFLEWLADELE